METFMKDLLDFFLKAIVVVIPILIFLFRVERRLTRIETLLQFCPRLVITCPPSLENHTP